MESQRNFLFITMLVLASVLWFKWVEFSAPPAATPSPAASNTKAVTGLDTVPADTTASGDQGLSNQAALEEVPSAPLNGQTTGDIPSTESPAATNLIRIETDLIKAAINPQGAVIEEWQLKAEPVSLQQPDQGFPLLVNSPAQRLVAQDGLLTRGQPAPNHANTAYQFAQSAYDLGAADLLRVPFTWDSGQGVIFTKTFVFKRNSYVVDIEYSINNQSTEAWSGAIYAQFLSTENTNKSGGFGQLPSYAGAAIYTEEEKYEKVSYKDMRKENLAQTTDAGWVAMLQHYFVGAWIPKSESGKTFYTATSQNRVPATYRVGYRNQQLTTVAPGSEGQLRTTLYLGSKEQKRLKALQEEQNITGLALTVDYGFLTFIADPLFIVLSWIHDVVGNWGWAIILLTILIKIVFYPLSAASYKSMAGMKKLQPRIQTLKERYKDDRQKFQMEMMALYKKEKINPAGGCLPILIQIPVFIALYWVLLESVEMRHAPFALWLQDLSAPDPYYILPVLMGVSMWAQQKLNPAPMDDIQKKVMMIMPIALTFLFLTFPQGLVLYWVVNNVLSIAQQWLINKQHAA